MDYSEYEAADEKEFVTGKVNSIQDYGAFITLKEGVDGLVHISQIQEGGVGKVSDVLSQGQEVQVRIVSVDKSKGRIGLSMKPWVEGAEEEQGGRRSRRDSGGPDGDDAAFQMTAEELEGLAVENDAERVALRGGVRARGARPGGEGREDEVRAPDALSARRRGAAPGGGRRAGASCVSAACAENIDRFK